MFAFSSSGTPHALAPVFNKEIAMANKTLFRSLIGKFIPPADTRNEAGGLAYQLSPKAALAQYAATGCLSTTFYASAEDQLQTVLNLCSHPEVDPGVHRPRGAV
jgi:hypothetical protein